MTTPRPEVEDVEKAMGWVPCGTHPLPDPSECTYCALDILADEVNWLRSALTASEQSLAEAKDMLAFEQNERQHLRDQLDEAKREGCWHTHLSSDKKDPDIVALETELATVRARASEIRAVAEKYREALIEIAERVNNEGDDSQACVSDNGYVARISLEVELPEVL